MFPTRPLRIFLCHASADKSAVYWLYRYLVDFEIDAWLDMEKLLPGQDWKEEIPKAIENSDAVIICLSKDSVYKKGYVQREIRFALDIAQEMPLTDRIFLVPVRLDDYDILPDLPDELKRRHYVNLFEENGFVKLLGSLQLLVRQIDPNLIVNPAGGSMNEKSKQLATIIIRENNWKQKRTPPSPAVHSIPVDPPTTPLPQRIKKQSEETTSIWGVGLFFTVLFALLALGTSLFVLFKSTQTPMTKETSALVSTTKTPTFAPVLISYITETSVVSILPAYTPTLFQEMPAQNPPTQMPPTQIPPTQVPPTQIPPTQVPPTQVPPTPTPLRGDLNHDGVVDCTDVNILLSVYRTAVGDPNWNPEADLRPDGFINVLDMGELIRLLPASSNCNPVTPTAFGGG